MKTDIHPTINDAAVTCACGAKFTLKSPLKEIKVDLCNQCHPFITGKEKLVDTAGRVDKFKAKMEKMKAMQDKTGEKKNKIIKEDTTRTDLDALSGKPKEEKAPKAEKKEVKKEKVETPETTEETTEVVEEVAEVTEETTEVVEEVTETPAEEVAEETTEEAVEEVEKTEE